VDLVLILARQILTVQTPTELSQIMDSEVILTEQILMDRTHMANQIKEVSILTVKILKVGRTLMVVVDTKK